MRNTDKQRGFTLIELMIGLALGLIASLAIFTTITTFEAQRRATASGADMQQNGLLSLYFIEQDVRMAGFGLIDASTTPGLMPCVTVNNVSIAPVSIADGGTGSDTLTTHRLDSDMGGIVTGGHAAMLTSPLSTIGSINSITIDTAKAIHLNDYLLIPDASKNCNQLRATSAFTPAQIVPVSLAIPAVSAVAAVAAVPASPAIPAVPAVPAKNGRAGTPAIPAVPASPGVAAVPGTPAVAAVPAVTATSTIINLGQAAPAFPALQYRINASNLEHSTDGGTTWSSIASNIVNMQVQYGVAVAGTQPVACWTDATGSACNGTNWANPSAADIARIKAIRVAVVARSSQRTANVTTTTNPISWTQPATTPVSSAAPVISLSTSVGTDWGHYRYKVYQTIIPIRNVIWGNL